MVSLKTVDRLVGSFILLILLFSVYSWWSAVQRASAMMMQMPGADPVWYLFSGLVAAGVVFGSYALGRDHVAQAISEREESASATVTREEPSTEGGQAKKVESERSDEGGMANQLTAEEPSVLTVLPEDERRVLRPIIESPGLTQVELRGRSDFSKAKVSQTVSELEDRGLIYRERQGRTYRIYPGELLKENS